MPLPVLIQPLINVPTASADSLWGRGAIARMFGTSQRDWDPTNDRREPNQSPSIARGRWTKRRKYLSRLQSPDSVAAIRCRRRHLPDDPISSGRDQLISFPQSPSDRPVAVGQVVTFGLYLTPAQLLAVRDKWRPRARPGDGHGAPPRECLAASAVQGPPDAARHQKAGTAAIRLRGTS